MDGEAVGKRVLIISYYWPPSGGIAVLRCLKFAKYLRSCGWEPVVFTAEGAHYPTIDASNERDIPPDLEVIRHPIWEPYAWYKRFVGKPADANVNNVFYTDETKGGWKHWLAVWVRSNFFIPDARATWIRSSVDFLLRYLEHHPVAAILSDGPPHTNTRIATLVSRRTGTPWLADFQDPWTQVDYYKLLNISKWGHQKHKRLEQEAFQQANLTTIVSPSWKNDLERIGAVNVRVLYWGYDPEDYSDLQRSPHTKFTLTHLGIMGYDRHPTMLFRAIAELKEREPNFADDFELRLFGQVDHRVRQGLADHGLIDVTHFGGNISRREALQEMADSHLLLLLLNQQANARGRIPGKLFEYLAVRRPIMNFGPQNSDVAIILNETQSGPTFTYDAAPANPARYIQERYWAFKAGKDKPLDKAIIQKYSHPILIKQLAGYLNELVL